MKQILVQLCIMLVVFLAIWFLSPFIIAGMVSWPDWLKDSNVQFLISLVVATLFAFNPGTAHFVRNKVVIKGSNNQVIQGTRTAGKEQSVYNSAKINGDQNKVEQG